TWKKHSLGTNWVQSVGSYFETIAIRADGTLWVSETPRSPVIRSWELPEAAAPLVQVGAETNWKQVVRDLRASRSALLLKTDGTLWRWRDTNRGPNRISLAATKPHRLGADSDWARIIPSGGRVYLTKSDGRVWTMNWPSTKNSTELESGISIERWPAYDGIEWRSLASSSACELGVKAAGTLWA